MNDKDYSLLADLDVYRREMAMTQIDLGDILGVSQGHLSKILSRKTPLSRVLAHRIQTLIGGAAVDENFVNLEREALRLLRTSNVFRELMHAAIRMHNSREKLDGRAGSDPAPSP